MGINDKDHVHDENCDCGHDHDGEQQTVTLTLEDDSEMECAILGTFDVDNSEYIALMPLDREEALIYKFAEHEDGQVELSLIEDEDEFEKVSEAFYEVFADEFEDDEDFEYEEDEEIIEEE